MWLWERLWLWCFREQITRCISARWNEGDDTGRDESDSWELHMWCFWLNIPYFSTYDHGSNICSSNQHPHVEDYSNCFSNMLRSETAQFSHFKSVEYPQENRKPVRAHYGRKCKSMSAWEESRHVTELSTVIPLRAVGQGEDVCVW